MKKYLFILLFLLFTNIAMAESIITSLSYPDILIPGLPENFVADVIYESGKTNYTDEGLRMVLQVFDLDNATLCSSTVNSDISGRIFTSCSIFTASSSVIVSMNVSDNSGVQSITNKTITVGHSKCEITPLSKSMDLGSTGTESFQFKVTNPKNEKVAYDLEIIETGELPIRFSLTEGKNLTVIVPSDSFSIGYIDIFPVLLGKHDYSLKCYSNLSRMDNYTQEFSATVRVLTTRAGITYVLVPDLDVLNIIFILLFAFFIFLRIYK